LKVEHLCEQRIARLDDLDDFGRWKSISYFSRNPWLYWILDDLDDLDGKIVVLLASFCRETPF
jgi:hypothetical protein